MKIFVAIATFLTGATLYAGDKSYQKAVPVEAVKLVKEDVRGSIGKDNDNLRERRERREFRRERRERRERRREWR